MQKKDNPKIVALYGHLSKILAIKGTEVQANTIIGKSGHSGFVFSSHGGNGAHLHFAIMVDGVWIDPMKFFDTVAPTPISKPVHISVKNSDERPPVNEYTEYTVIKGDTLYGIAKKKLGDAERWRDIYHLNYETIENPKYIKPGQIIKLPNKKK